MEEVFYVRLKQKVEGKHPKSLIEILDHSAEWYNANGYSGATAHTQEEYLAEQEALLEFNQNQIAEREAQEAFNTLKESMTQQVLAPLYTLIANGYYDEVLEKTFSIDQVSMDLWNKILNIWISNLQIGVNEGTDIDPIFSHNDEVLYLTINQSQHMLSRLYVWYRENVYIYNKFTIQPKLQEINSCTTVEELEEIDMEGF